MDETALTEQAVIDWIKTFDLPSGGGCASLEELCDGCVIAAVLSELVPEHFEWTSMAAATGNWAIAVGNLKSIVKSLEAYYHGVLGKRVVDLDTLDCKAIARNNDTDELLNLLELVIGVAILCEHKARHIQEIFSLGQETQTELKVLIECVMGRLSDVDADAEVGEAEGEGFSASASASASTSAQGEAGGDTEAGTVAELKEERRRLLASMQTLESANSGLEAQVEALALEVQGLSESQSHGQGHGGSGSGSGAGAGAGAGDATAALQQQLFDCRRELDDRTLELESAGAELQGLHALLSTARQMQSKSELEVQMAADKLELATETQVRLTQAEALLEKYKRRLEELPQLRHESKESAAKLDEYIERCHNLEAGNAKLSQLLEASGVRSGELERRGMRGEAEVTTLREELAGVREELEREQAARRVSEVDAKDARAEMVELKAAAEVAIASAHDNAEVAVEREMNKAHDKQLKQLAAESRSSASASADQQSEALRLLEAELVAVTERKEEREQQWLDAKKQVVIAQQELATSRKTVGSLQAELAGAKLAQAGGGGAGSEEQEMALQKLCVQLKEAEQQIALQSKTSKMYEDRFREKDAQINTLEQEKDKLETFTKRTLTAFKGKFLQSLEAVREEKRALEAQLEEVIAKYQANKETAGREERLVMSAMYEIGLRTIDQNISAQLGKQVKGAQ